MSEDVHALVGAYALGAVDDEEREAFERHLAQCADCQQELPGLEAAVARLGSAEVATPPAHLRSSVMQRVAQTRQLPPASRAEVRARARWGGPLAAAAAVVLVVALAALGGLALQQQRLGDARQQAGRIAAVASDPQKHTTTVRVVGGGTAEITAAHGAAIVAMRGMPAAPENHIYQLWKKLPDDSVVSLGVLGRSPSKPMFVDELGDTTALAVTVERDGGVDQPTTTPIIELPV